MKTQELALLTLSGLAIATLSCLAAPDNSDPAVTPFVTCPEKSAIRSNLRHPILNVFPFQDLGELQLPEGIYKQLNSDILFNSAEEHLYISNSNCFHKAEVAAANQFAKLVIGMETDSVLDLAGASYKRSPSNYWKQPESKNSEYWLYFLGYSRVPVMLKFKDNYCITAKILSKSELDQYVEWCIYHFKQLEGKSVQMILQSEGQPDKATDTPIGEEFWRYAFTRDLSAELKISKDFCTDVHFICKIGFTVKKAKKSCSRFKYTKT